MGGGARCSLGAEARWRASALHPPNPPARGGISEARDGAHRVVVLVPFFETPNRQKLRRGRGCISDQPLPSLLALGYKAIKLGYISCRRAASASTRSLSASGRSLLKNPPKRGPESSSSADFSGNADMTASSRIPAIVVVHSRNKRFHLYRI